MAGLTKCALVDCDKPVAPGRALCADHRAALFAAGPHVCVIAGCRENARPGRGTCAVHADAGTAAMFSYARTYDPMPAPPPKPRHLAMFDEAARRLKAAWRALRYGEMD